MNLATPHHITFNAAGSGDILMPTGKIRSGPKVDPKMYSPVGCYGTAEESPMLSCFMPVTVSNGWPVLRAVLSNVRIIR